MATIADWLKVNPGRTAQNLNDAVQKLESAQGELVVDFSAVHRIDASSLKAMEKLAEAAGERKVKLVLKGVGVDVYKVFKLAKLTSRFSCIS